jgi:hypothetical protein
LSINVGHHPAMHRTIASAWWFLRTRWDSEDTIVILCFALIAGGALGWLIDGRHP